MNGKNTHTSVVIKLPNGVNMYKIDLEDVEASKEYVIDQLFCDDDIAVYAVFEASDGNSQRNPKKVSPSDFSESRLSQRRSYAKLEEGKTWPDTLVDSEEERFDGLEGITDHLNPPRNCNRDGNFSGLGETKERTKFKSASKGVNTDIGQSPRLLEEVRKAVSLNFSESGEKNTGPTPVFTVKSSYDVREMMSRVSSTTFSLDEENGSHGKKSPPNIVIVPVVIKDKEFNYWMDDKSQQSPCFNRNLSSKTSITLEKVSISTSAKFSLPEYRNNEEPKTRQNEPDNNTESDEKGENEKSQEYLLEEIKTLQEKFNALVKSLEIVGFTFSEQKEIKGRMVEPKEEKPVRKRLNKFDEIPIFSPDTRVASELKNLNPKTTNQETSRIASNSESVVVDGKMTDRVYDKKETEHTSEVIWMDVKNHRGAKRSKSQTNNHSAEWKNNSLKKSLSLNVGGEALGSKKLENIFFKLEGSIKNDKKKILRQNEKFELVDKLSEAKLHECQNLQSVAVKSKINYYITNATADGLLKMQKDKSNKSLEKEIMEKSISNRVRTRMNSVDSGDVKDTKVTKKAELKCRTTEKVKLETKNTACQEAKEKVRSVIRRVSRKDSPQSKLHVDLLIKNHQNREQKHIGPIKSNSTRMPRPSFQKKDQRTPNKNKKLDMERSLGSEMSVRKNFKPEETRNEAQSPDGMHQTTSAVVVELFSKKPTSEDFYSEVDLKCLYGNDATAKGTRGSGKSENSNECQNPVVKSVWALTKVLLYEDGTKKMEVLEASLNPTDYCFNQNLTEDKVR